MGTVWQPHVDVGVFLDGGDEDSPVGVEVVDIHELADLFEDFTDGGFVLDPAWCAVDVVFPFEEIGDLVRTSPVSSSV